ncbi:MAG: dihydropteroate synthase [Coriobacteriales bacterium]|jgi:dihydropteroate synthase|nr:dihydropteroate synthase [Coriobacteriales bacterium]
MWHCGTFEFDTATAATPLIMGILNVTPDSFSDGGAHDTPDAALAHARLLLQQGAHIIDVGGESTRPGSDEVCATEELARVLPVVRELAAEGVAVSIDTRHAEVAAACVKAGAAVINDITGFRDAAMVELARGCDAGLVVMHMQGEPKTMQAAPVYANVVAEVSAYLLARARELEAAGVARGRICLDPGPGFGKSFEHNLALLRATDQLAALGAEGAEPPPRALEAARAGEATGAGEAARARTASAVLAQAYPLMAAWSRKRFVGELTGVELAAERVAGSVAVAAYAAARGARVLRVHDVAPTVEALKVLAALGGGAREAKS